jgi:hypothetical protein
MTGHSILEGNAFGEGVFKTLMSTPKMQELLSRYPPRIDLLRKAAGCRIPVPNKLRPFSS